jgi:ankyrin repeat protein
VKHGASVHEVVYGRTLTMLNLLRKNGSSEFLEPHLLEFFAILHSECYMDFNNADERDWCALVNAIRSKAQGLDALKFLSKVGVDFTRIAKNSRSPLHWAAEMADDPRVVEFLCLSTGHELINRQDSWDWTPLHYAIVSVFLGYNDGGFEKIRLLLQHGADPEIKARSQPFLFTDLVQKEEFTPYELSQAFPEHIGQGYIQELIRAGRTVPEGSRDDEEDFFYDTIE